MRPIQVILRKLEGTISKSEEKFLDEWLQKSERNRILYSGLRVLKSEGFDISGLTELDSELEWKRVVAEYSSKITSQPKIPVARKLLRYAAVFAGLLALGYGYFEFNRLNDGRLEIESYTTDLQDDAVTLQLGSGELRVLAFDDAKAITDKQGNVLGKREGNKISYKGVEDMEALTYHTLKVPNGKRFEITLSDGTNIHLNSGSSLKYPVKFLKDGTRNVFLEGEAFFDVSTDKEHPFIVGTSEMDVTVLGTEFNVSSYPEDEDVNTVLVEGSVRLQEKKGKESLSRNSTLLKPGYKAQWNKILKKVSIDEVDTSIYTGWMKGKIIFKNVPFKIIRKRLERHYNVSIINNNKILEEKTFNAIFDIETIEQVLETLNENYEIQYTVNNAKIIIN